MIMENFYRRAVMTNFLSPPASASLAEAPSESTEPWRPVRECSEAGMPVLPTAKPNDSFEARRWFVSRLGVLIHKLVRNSTKFQKIMLTFSQNFREMIGKSVFCMCGKSSHVHPKCAEIRRFSD